MKLYFKIILFVFLLILPLGHKASNAQFFFFQNEKIGKDAPEFTLKTLKGEEMSLSESRDGKKAIIFFWATWCPHCREALHVLNQQREDFVKKDIRIILVDVGETEELVRKYVEKNKIVFDIFLDKDNILEQPYGIIGVPTFFFVNKDGIVQDVQHTLPEDYEKILSASSK